MDLSSPISSVIPSSQGAVLAVLARTDRLLSGRRTAELTGGRVSRRQVDHVLRELTKAGVVTCEVQPPANLYRLNRVHLAAQAIEMLVGMRDHLMDLLREEIEGWSIEPTAAWLFGSAARGDGGVDSDIDILVIRADSADVEDVAWRTQLDDLAEQLTAWTGNGCELLEYSETEFKKMVSAGERLVGELRRDALHISGKAVSSFVGRQA